MNFLRRFIYLLYYLRESDFKQLGYFIRYSSAISGKSKPGIVIDTLYSIFRYNISLKDYFCFRFFELRAAERDTWAGTGFMYEYQLKMNPRVAREVLENKILFLNRFKPFVRRKFLSLAEIENDQGRLQDMLDSSSGRMVLKGSRGQVGAQVEVIRSNSFTVSTLIEYMKNRKFDLAEEYVIQHPSLNDLSPSGLNTVRIITQLDKGGVKILGARLRVSVNSQVDNMAAGNLAAPVDLASGIIIGPGVYSDITKDEMSTHPITGKAIAGFSLPYWKEVLALAGLAASQVPGNRSVGWDIAITSEGPELIEGNHNWCKLLWQLPVKKGLKKELEIYL